MNGVKSSTSSSSQFSIGCRSIQQWMTLMFDYNSQQATTYFLLSVRSFSVNWHREKMPKENWIEFHFRCFFSFHFSFQNELTMRKLIIQCSTFLLVVAVCVWPREYVLSCSIFITSHHSYVLNFILVFICFYVMMMFFIRLFFFG